MKKIFVIALLALIASQSYAQHKPFFRFFSKSTTTATAAAPAPAPVADLVLTNSNIIIQKYLTGGAMVDASFTGGKLAPRDITADPFFSIATSTGFHYWEAWSGQTTQGDRPDPKRDGIAIGGSGNGYNWTGTDDIKGAGSFTGKINGKNVDFYNSFTAFVKKSGGGAVISANVETGTLDDVIWKINQVGAANVYAVVFGQEENLKQGFFGGDYNKYVDKINPWIDAVHSQFPGIICAACAAPVFTGKQTDRDCNSILHSRGHMDAVTCYTQFDECTSLTGNLPSDILLVEAAPAIVTGWLDQLYSTFGGIPIFDMQFNSSDQFSDSGAIVYPDAYISTGMWSTNTLTAIANWNRTHNNGCRMIVCQTVKNITNGNDCALDINGQVWKQFNFLFAADGCYATTEIHTGTSPLIAVRTATGNYLLLFENHSGSDVTLPASVSIDGVYKTVNWNTGSFFYSTSITATSVSAYTCTGSLKNNSFGSIIIYK